MASHWLTAVSREYCTGSQFIRSHAVSCTWQEDLGSKRVARGRHSNCARARSYTGLLLASVRPCALMPARCRSYMRAVPARAAPGAAVRAGETAKPRHRAGRAPMSALYRAVDMHSSAFLLVCFCAALPALRCGLLCSTVMAWPVAGGYLASGPRPLCSPSTTCTYRAFRSRRPPGLQLHAPVRAHLVLSGSFNSSQFNIQCLFDVEVSICLASMLNNLGLVRLIPYIRIGARPNSNELGER
jgi:hypothetical protein